jgi:hypothetical protein
MYKSVRTLFLGAVLLLTAGFAPAAWAALTDLGVPIAPHGFPAFYQDSNGLALEPCLLPPAGNATRADLCILDPVNPTDPNSVDLGVGSESFWWMADAQAPPLVGGGKALLVLALEAAFAVEVPKNGDQMTFGRIRIRIDTPVAGQYTVTHPFGSEVFDVVDVAAGINFTEDIGAINTLNPTLGFTGALGSDLGPFLTWPGYDQDPTLQVRDATGNVLEQYVGDPNVPHVVTSGPNGNVFRVVGPGGITTETDLFTVMGKVFDPTVVKTAHVFPLPPGQNLFAVGPVNRLASIDTVPVPGTVTGVERQGYPRGFPLWYQDNAGTVEAPEAGLQLTICPAVDPMCISAPIDPADPASVALRAGEEGFWWTGEAFLDEDTPDATVPAGLKGLLVLAMEAAFGGTGVPAERQQIGFGRIRIRVDVPAEGHYTITHPYGVEEFDVVFDPAETDPRKLGLRAINMTRDIMGIDPANPDSAFAGALFGGIGPRFLTWPDFANPAVPGNEVLQKLLDPNDPQSAIVQYVGDPNVPHVVLGSPNGTNHFRIQGPGGIDVTTSLFAVSGKVFNPDTFNVVLNPNAPVANANTATTDAGSPATVNVLANDTTAGGVQATPASVNVTLLPPGEAFGPADGAVQLNADDTVTYTPNAGFDGVDSFAYQITDVDNGLISGTAVVTVTVVPVETFPPTRVRFDQRRLQLDVQGDSNFEGTTLTIRAGSATGPVLGTALVSNGRWRFRGTLTSNVTSISIVSSTGKTLLNQPLQVR